MSGNQIFASFKLMDWIQQFHIGNLCTYVSVSGCQFFAALPPMQKLYYSSLRVSDCCTDEGLTGFWDLQ